MTAHTPLSQIAAAARLMLDDYDAFMNCQPYDKEFSRHVTLAACFGASAYEAAPCTDSGTHAMLRAFLLALIDPLHPDLDYLRADPQAGVTAREGRADG